jgi:hypothetical protein
MTSPRINTNLRSPEAGSPDAVLMSALGVPGPEGVYNESGEALGEDLLTYDLSCVDFDEFIDMDDVYAELGIGRRRGILSQIPFVPLTRASAPPSQLNSIAPRVTQPWMAPTPSTLAHAPG